MRRIASGERVNDADVDWPNIAEEIETLARSERAAVANRIATIIEHLIKLEANWLPWESLRTLVGARARQGWPRYLAAASYDRSVRWHRRWEYTIDLLVEGSQGARRDSPPRRPHYLKASGLHLRPLLNFGKRRLEIERIVLRL